MSELPWVRGLPSGWRALRLGRVASITNSNVDKKSYDDGQPVRLCNYTDVYKNEFITDRMEFMEATATSNEIRRFTLRPTDVVITKDSESWNDIAVAACVAEPLRDVVCGYHLAVLRADFDLLHGRFLHRALQATGVREQFWLAANGVTRFGLGLQGIKEALLPIPPLATQIAIADYLDEKTADIDALIERKRKLLDLLAEERAALINQAVTKGLDPTVPMKDSGIQWIGEIPAHWNLTKIRYNASVVSKGTTPSTVGADLTAEGIRFLKAENLRTDGTVSSNPEFYIDQETDRLLRRSRLKANDVLVVIAGATTGKAALLTEGLVPANTNQAVCFIRLNRSGYAPFLRAWISTPGAQQHVWLSAVQAAQPNLSMENLRSFPCPWPPDSKIAHVTAHLRSIDEHFSLGIECGVRQLDRLQEYRQALITTAVTGQLDIEAAA